MSMFRHPVIKDPDNPVRTLLRSVARFFRLECRKPEVRLTGTSLFRAASPDPPPVSGGGTDQLVGVDGDATPGFLGAANNDGVLRTDSPLTYSDGGDYVTLGMDESAIDHGSLSGLGDDDHPQYLKEKGSGGLASETPTHTHQDAANCGQLDHGAALTGLADDDHTQYAKLAGRSGGQILKGGIAASESLKLRSTDNATKGTVHIGEVDFGEQIGNGMLQVTASGFLKVYDNYSTLHHDIGTTGAVVFNESGADIDTRIEGDTDVNLIKVDAGLDKVGIGVATPLEKLHCSAKVRADTAFNVNGNDGITQVIIILDGDRVTNHLLTFEGGILVRYHTA